MMNTNYVTYNFTDNEKIPAIISANGNSTLVWLQSEWDSGEYVDFINKNGCGHCCTAMVLNLHGIKINPHEEFSLCRQLWGEPRMGAPLYEDNFISASGIVKILKNFGIEARAFGVQNGKCNECAKHIQKELSDGKQVILWSHPADKLSHNPFSTGDHYVLLAGICENGKILVANSSVKGDTDKGIQYTDIYTIKSVLLEGCEPDDTFTWGRYDLCRSGGYVVVGSV